MGNLFQFTMRRMFPAMVLFCFAAWLLSIVFRPFGHNSDGFDLIASAEFVGAIASAIAGVGAITETKLAIVVRAVILLFLGSTAVFFLVVNLHLI